ncbi:diguanylate cyclase [Catenovulum agarivorans DS-2]|uniref:diguanylate cyclase n=1 Tax=Catenovulum agarivorans DS-2 TaxID=1328313 RepID=W7QGW2_9ALTE|nr:GGDEF domain-containing protein [Catenovulum agarivorans]EWH12179.1 diguanylate cyclase [Catenovulum agarivorans DS-2]
MTKRQRIAILFAVFLTMLGCTSLPANAKLKDISLQLRWKHQFQFAGYYIAKEKGLYEQFGLDVRIIPYSSNSPAPVDAILNNQADFAISSSAVAIHRMQSKPIVALAALMQSSPLIWLTLKKNGFSTPQDIVNEPLPILPQPESAELLTIFSKEGFNIDALNLVTAHASVDDLIVGNVAALNAYQSNEPYQIQQAGYEYNVIKPKDYGVNFYSDVLITHEHFAHANPRVVERFRDASLKGWQYALNHIDESVKIIHEKYATDKSLQHLQFEAQQLKKLIMPELVQLGHMNPDRWKTIANDYIQLNMAGYNPDISEIDNLIYRKPIENTRILIHTIIISLFIILVLSILAWRFFYLSASLKREISRREYAEKKLIKANNELKAQALTDPLTKIYNRRAFFEKGDAILKLSMRKQLDCAVIMLDIDYFKKINDTYGHDAGDAALIQITQRISQSIVRSHDILARVGGEEFAILMVDCHIDDASAVAQRILDIITAEKIFLPNGSSIDLTVSLGISEVELDLSQALTHADIALYQAKNQGRNCYCLFDSEQATTQHDSISA